MLGEGSQPGKHARSTGADTVDLPPTTRQVVAPGGPGVNMRPPVGTRVAEVPAAGGQGRSKARSRVPRSPPLRRALSPRGTACTCPPGRLRPARAAPRPARSHPAPR